jgi:hypothetical protein
MSGSFLQHVDDDPTKGYMSSIERLLGTLGTQGGGVPTNAPRLLHLGSVEADYRLNRVVITDGELGRVITVNVDCFNIFTGKRLAKPTPLGPAEVFEDSERGQARRCHYPLRVGEPKPIDFSFDHGSVPVEGTFKGFALTASHTKGVVHTRSLRSDQPAWPSSQRVVHDRRHTGDPSSSERLTMEASARNKA